MPELAALERSVDRYVESSKADNTLLAYSKQWAAFEAWCVTKAACALPATPETVALYLAACAGAGLAAATLAQAKAVLTRKHEDAGHTSPCASPHVKQAWAGIRRRLSCTFHAS